MQRPVPGGVLHDHLRGLVVGHMIVAALARAVADRNPVEQLVAAKQRLAQREAVAFAPQLDAERMAHWARAAVATDQIGGADLLGFAAAILDRGGDATLILLQRQKRA